MQEILENIKNIYLNFPMMPFLLLIGMIYILNSFKRYFLIFLLFSLPGTIMHELMHLIFSFLTYGKPVKFSLIPRKTQKGYILGYVSSSNITWFNAALIGLAPLLLIPISIYIFYYIQIINNIYYQIFLIYLLATTLYASIPSKQDFYVSFKYGWHLIFLSFLILFYYLYFHQENIFNIIELLNEKIKIYLNSLLLKNM